MLMYSEPERRMSRTREVLKDALHLLETRGWKQGSYGSGPFCMMGALRRTTLHTQEIWDATRALGFPGGGSDVAEWNDLPFRKWEHVKERFEQAIAREEAKAEAEVVVR